MNKYVYFVDSDLDQNINFILLANYNNLRKKV